MPCLDNVTQRLRDVACKANSLYDDWDLAYTELSEYVPQLEDLEKDVHELARLMDELSNQVAY